MTSYFPTKLIFLLSIILSMVFLAFNQGIYSFLVILVFIIYYLLNFHYKVFIYSSIILFISFTRFGFAASRDIITLTLVVLLYYLFFKEYGFNYKQFPRLPRP